MARLTKIYTRTGDSGETGLVGNRRVSKDSPRIWACGAVDELNSAIGLARAQEPGKKMDAVLAGIQNDLFNLGAELATMPTDFKKGMPAVGAKQIRAMERLLDRLNTQLGPLKEFIMPGGTKTAAALHLARAICRRAERECVALSREEELSADVVPYLNRLSDALFMLARWANREEHRQEAYWRK